MMQANCYNILQQIAEIVVFRSLRGPASRRVVSERVEATASYGGLPAQACPPVTQPATPDASRSDSQGGGSPRRA